MAPEPMHLAGTIKHCPRCDSTEVKFLYYNNFKVSQPRYRCRGRCKKDFTYGGKVRIKRVVPKPTAPVALTRSRPTSTAVVAGVAADSGGYGAPATTAGFARPRSVAQRVLLRSQLDELMEPPAMRARNDGRFVITGNKLPSRRVAQPRNPIQGPTPGPARGVAAGRSSRAGIVDADSPSGEMGIMQGGVGDIDWAKVVLGHPSYSLVPADVGIPMVRLKRITFKSGSEVLSVKEWFASVRHE